MSESDPAADTLRFVDTVEEADTAKDHTGVVPALLLPERVTPLIRSLNALTDEAEQISVLRPIVAFWQLKRIRPRSTQSASRPLQCWITVMID